MQNFTGSPSTPSNFLDFSVLKMAREEEKKNLEWAYHQFFFVFGFVVKVMLWNISNFIREKYPYDGASEKSVSNILIFCVNLTMGNPFIQL